MAKALHLALFLSLSIAVQNNGHAASIGINKDIRNTFFVGAFFDIPGSTTNQLTKYLVRPISGSTNELAGDELSGFVGDLLKKETGLLSIINLEIFDQAAGGRKSKNNSNAVAIYIPRAQHEKITYHASGVPDEYLTVVSISMSFDIFSDKAAKKNQLRLETIFSKLLVGEKAVIADTPLSDEKLAGIYRGLLVETFHELAERTIQDLAWNRDRAKVVFQLTDFKLPKRMLPQEIMQLINNTIGSANIIASEEALGREKARLSLELLHTVNQFVSTDLRNQSIMDIALLSPPTPWAQSNVGEKLKERLVGKKRAKNTSIRFYVDPTMEKGGEFKIKGKTSVVGYTITPGLVKAQTKIIKESKLAKISQFSTSLAARIYRPTSGKRKPKWMPVTVVKKKRTAKGLGYKDFKDIIGMQRPTTREIVMDAVRMASKELASNLVDLMKEIAANRLKNR